MNVPCKVFTRVPAANDEYGNVIYVEIENSTRCFIQPIALDLFLGGRGELSQFLVHLPASVVGILDGFARLEVGSHSYEAVEQPALFTSLRTSGVHHVELIVQEATS